jgi:hypothetical protein
VLPQRWEGDLMATVEVLDGESKMNSLSAAGLNHADRFSLSIQREAESFAHRDPSAMISIDDSLLKTTKAVCERNRLEFASLSQIQRKFLTHYRCGQCGLLPLYFLNLLHATRVRCRKCGQLTAFKRTGKYGKLRKEIAFALVKEIHGDVRPVYQ